MRRVKDQDEEDKGPGDQEDPGTRWPEDQRTRAPKDQENLNFFFPVKFIFPVKFGFCSRVLDLFPGNLDIFRASSRENPERILQEFQVPLGCEIVSLKKKPGFVDEIRSTVAEMAEIPRVPLQADLVQ